MEPFADSGNVCVCAEHESVVAIDQQLSLPTCIFPVDTSVLWFTKHSMSAKVCGEPLLLDIECWVVDTEVSSLQNRSSSR